LIIAIALLAPAITLSAGVRSLIGFGGGTHPVLGKARLVVSGPLGSTFFAHVWAAPSSSGGSCSFVVVDQSSSTPAHPTYAGGEGVCVGRREDQGQARLLEDGPWVVATASFPFAVELSIQRRPRGNAATQTPPFVVGAIYPGLRATRVVLEWKGGSEALALTGNHFVGGGPILYKPPFGNLPYSVVAYNASGREVARHKLNDPSLYLVDEGWKSFTPMYLAWKRSHPGG
jgi:hypothetical protein